MVIISKCGKFNHMVNWNLKKWGINQSFSSTISLLLNHQSLTIDSAHWLVNWFEFKWCLSQSNCLDYKADV